MKRKPIGRIVLFGVAVVGVYLILVIFGNSHIGNGSSLRSVDKFDEISEIPIYNGATITKNEDTLLKDGSYNITYWASAPVGNIEAFYKEQLTKLGWQTNVIQHRRAWGNSAGDFRTPPPDDTVDLYFFKLNDNSSEPYDLSLVVEIVDYRYTTGAISSSLVRLGLSRVPNLGRIPLVPGAMNIVTDSNHLPIGEHGSYYETTATLQEVRDFYTNKMPQYGWYLEGNAVDINTGNQIPDSLLFTWHLGGVETKSWDARVVVRTERPTDKGSRVYLSVAGATNLR